MARLEKAILQLLNVKDEKKAEVFHHVVNVLLINTKGDFPIMYDDT